VTKPIGCRVVTFVEQRVERFEDEAFVLLGGCLHRKASAAVRITSITTSGLDSIGTWLLSAQIPWTNMMLGLVRMEPGESQTTRQTGSLQ
jgi:hypothetical protein